MMSEETRNRLDEWSFNTMFERYTQDARRALFCARASTVERLGDSITPEDILGGIVWSAPRVTARFALWLTDALTPSHTVEDIEDFMSRLARDASSPKEILFSEATKMALGRAAEEADALSHNAIRPEHLLLGLLRDEKSQAWRTLDEAGITLRDVRRIMAEEPDDPL